MDHRRAHHDVLADAISNIQCIQKTLVGLKDTLARLSSELRSPVIEVPIEQESPAGNHRLVHVLSEIEQASPTAEDEEVPELTVVTEKPPETGMWWAD